MGNSGERKHVLITCVGLIVLTVAVYWQVFGHEFVSFDDLTYAAENDYVRSGLTWEGVKWAFTTNATANWHPLTWLSLMLDCQLFENTARACHAANALLHILNTLLLFAILKRATGAVWRSAFAAALFALHPLHVESVAWVSERKDVLSTFFWMLTMWAYVRYTERPSVKKYLPVTIFLGLGLMAKPMLVTLPCVLLLFDYWPLQRFGFVESKQGRRSRTRGGFEWGKFGRMAIEKAPLLALIIVSSLITFIVQRGAGVMSSMGRLDIGLRIGNAFSSYTGYLLKMLWPAKLAAFYPYIEVPVWHHVVAGIAVVLVTLAVILWGRRKRYLLVGWLWYVGTLVPVIGLVQVGMQRIADRYTYVPLIGIFIIISWGAWGLLEKLSKARLTAVLGSTAIIFVLSWFTWFQVGTWRNNFTLYEHAIAVTRGNFLAHNNLGAALQQEGRLDEAMEHWQEALKINPAHRDSASNMGRELVNRGRYAEAIEVYEKYLGFAPGNYEMCKRLGDALLSAERYDEAIDTYRESLQLQPILPGAHRSMGLAFARQGKDEEAIREYEKCLEQNPQSYRAHHNLGTMLTKKGEFREAERHYRKALELKDDYVSAYCNLAVVLTKQKRVDEAIEQYRAALAIEKDNEKAARGLAALVAAQQGTQR